MNKQVPSEFINKPYKIKDLINISVKYLVPLDLKRYKP